MYWLCQEGMIWIWIVHKIVQLGGLICVCEQNICLKWVLALKHESNYGVYFNVIFILFSRIWSHFTRLNVMNTKRLRRVRTRLSVSISSGLIVQHGEVDQTTSATPLGASDFKSIPFRVCNAAWKFDACISHSQFISVGYYLTLPLSQLVAEAFIILHKLTTWSVHTGVLSGLCTGRSQEPNVWRQRIIDVNAALNR